MFYERFLEQNLAIYADGISALALCDGDALLYIRWELNILSII